MEMLSTIWTPEHCETLRAYLEKGLSYSEVARQINASFKTAYSRSAVIGRAKRMGLASSDRPKKAAGPKPRPQAGRQPREDKRRKTAKPARPVIEPTPPVKLRCVGVAPRLVSLAQLEPGDCRYPYGGDHEGEAITFCGHPRSDGSSYCEPHFHLTLGLGTPSERAAGPVLLRLVRAA
jgi:GcrA cell cycle regulator